MSLADDKAGDDYTEEFVRNIDSLSKADLHRFARVIDMNRLTLATYEHLKCCKGKTSLTLGKYLEPFVLRQQRLRQYRDRLLRKLVYLLEDSKIEYVVYKTMNLSKWVGVDIDVLVDSSSLDECILILLANGFHPTENLSKKYATHLAAERNPIAVDLHAKTTVFGIPYMSSDIL
ncbi:MAG: nucleotidyltransferase family protein, partial [Candidatus Bathyarchaeia archaeon]